jgi:hypothetical protein
VSLAIPAFRAFVSKMSRLGHCRCVPADAHGTAERRSCGHSEANWRGVQLRHGVPCQVRRNRDARFVAVLTLSRVCCRHQCHRRMFEAPVPRGRRCRVEIEFDLRSPLVLSQFRRLRGAIAWEIAAIALLFTLEASVRSSPDRPPMLLARRQLANLPDRSSTQARFTSPLRSKMAYHDIYEIDCL